MSKEVNKPEEIEEDVNFGDVLSQINVTGVGGSSGRGKSGMSSGTIFGMFGTVITEAALAVAEKRRAIELVSKEVKEKMSKEQLKLYEETWIAVVRPKTIKMAAKLTAKELSDRLGNTKMSQDDWRNQTVNVRGKKVPVGIYSADSQGLISSPTEKTIDSYGPIFASKTKRIAGLHGVLSDDAAVIELKGKFARFAPKKGK